MVSKIFARIRVRRGLQQDLPQLSGGEFGWSQDQQRLFVGSGPISEGAPSVSNVEVLTEASDNINIVDYTYESNTPVIAQTGPTASSPIVRTLQQRLDDYVSIKSFGAVGDGINDDSAAWNRAISQLYCQPLAPSEYAQEARRTLYLPAGIYNMKTNMLLVPPHLHVAGEGKNASVIQLDATSTLDHLFRTCDSDEQISTNIGNNSAELPNDILFENVGLSRPAYGSIGLLERVSDVEFKRCSISSCWISPLTAATVLATPTGNTLFFTAVPTGVAVGQIVTDTTSAGVIPANTTVVSFTATTIVLSAYVTGGGVALGDSIVFTYTSSNIFDVDVLGAVLIPDGFKFDDCEIYGYYDILGVTNASGTKNVDFINSKIHDGYRGVQASNYMENVKISGCNFYNISDRGIYAITNASEVKSIGNKFTNVGVTNLVNPVEFNSTTANCSSISDTFDTVISGGCSVVDTVSTAVPTVLMNSKGLAQFQNVVMSARLGPITLTDNTASATATGISFILATATCIFLDYVLVRNADYRIGQLKIVSDGSANVYLYDDNYENLTSGTVFSASISGSNVLIKYTTTSTGYNATLYYSYRYFNYS